MDKILLGLCIISITNLVIGQTENFKFEADNLNPKAGSTVIFTCTVVGKTPLDFIKTFRRVNGKTNEIATNNYPSDVFKDSGRYNVDFSVEGETTVFTLTISDLQGKDSGEIGCEWVKTPPKEERVQTLKVQVAPASVTLFNIDPETQEETPVSENGIIQMTEGQSDGFGCRADMQDYTSSDKPTVHIMIGQDEISAPNTETGPVVSSEQGFQRVDYKVEAKYVTDATKASDSGKTVACQVKVGDKVISANPAAATAKYMVLYKPKMRCSTRPLKAYKDSADYMLSCSGTMDPAPTESSWTWQTPEGDSVTLTPTDTSNVEFTAMQDSKGNNVYEFTLKLTTVDLEDFHDYQLIVTNPVGSEKAVFKLEQQIETTLPPTETKKPDGNGKPVNPGPTYDVNNNNNNNNGGDKSGDGSSASSATFSIILLITSILSIFICDHL